MKPHMARHTEGYSVLDHVSKIGIRSPLFDVMGDNVLCCRAYLARVIVSFEDAASPYRIAARRAVHVCSASSEPVRIGVSSQALRSSIFPRFGFRSGSTPAAHAGFALLAERLPRLSGSLGLSRTRHRTVATLRRPEEHYTADFARLLTARPTTALEAGIGLALPLRPRSTFDTALSDAIRSTARRMTVGLVSRYRSRLAAEPTGNVGHRRSVGIALRDTAGDMFGRLLVPLGNWHEGAPSEGQVLLRRRHQNGPREGIQKHLTSYRRVSVAHELYQIDPSSLLERGN